MSVIRFSSPVRLTTFTSDMKLCEQTRLRGKGSKFMYETKQTKKNKKEKKEYGLHNVS